MLSALDTATRHHHSEADEPWHELFHGVLSVHDYAQHLVSLYGFEAPVEAALALTPQLGMSIGLRFRSRSGFLVQDLHALGMRPFKLARLPQCPSVVPFRDPVEALGWVYVLERAGIHFAALRIHLERCAPHMPVSYLSSRPSDAYVKELEEALQAEAGDDAAAARVVTAATRAFAVQREWFECGVRVSSPDLAAAR